MTIAIVGGALANKPGNGGAAWTRLSWTLGLAQLGFDVHFVEQLAHPDPAAEAWFAQVMSDFGLQERSTLVRDDGSTAHGLDRAALGDLAAQAVVLVNISGHLRDAALLERVETTVFVDLDPGYTQLWHADGTAKLAHHDHWFTVGTLIGTPECDIPTCGVPWRPTLQPVVLEHWPVQPAIGTDRFTTVGSWRGPFGPVEHSGRTLGSKVHEFRRFMDLPRHVETALELCLDIHIDDGKDRAALEAAGWHVVDARSLDSPQSFRRYVQGSPAEFSVAQATYVQANTGWFSDRSVRYLASGRPVVVQETGVASVLQPGEGLLTFDDFDTAVSAIAAVLEEPTRHANAARSIAVEHFAAEKVLGRLCAAIDVAP